MQRCRLQLRRPFLHTFHTLVFFDSTDNVVISLERSKNRATSIHLLKRGKGCTLPGKFSELPLASSSTLPKLTLFLNTEEFYNTLYNIPYISKRTCFSMLDFVHKTVGGCSCIYIHELAVLEYICTYVIQSRSACQFTVQRDFIFKPTFNFLLLQLLLLSL